MANGEDGSMSNGDDYRAGRVDAELKGIHETLDHINKKLDNNIEWQANVAGRLAAGAEKFEQLQGGMDAHTTAIQELQKKDKGVLAIASTVGGAIGAAAAVAIKLLTAGKF